MGPLGIPELIVIAFIAMLLFGANRIANIGKGFGQGIRQFKEGLRDEDREMSTRQRLRGENHHVDAE